MKIKSYKLFEYDDPYNEEINDDEIEFDAEDFLNNRSEIESNGYLLDTKEGVKFLDFYETLIRTSRDEFIESARDAFNNTLPPGIDNQSHLDLLIGSIEYYILHLQEDLEILKKIR